MYADVMKFIHRLFTNTLFEKERVYGTSLKNPENAGRIPPYTLYCIPAYKFCRKYQQCHVYVFETMEGSFLVRIQIKQVIQFY